jgi:hypothetical protein
MIHLLEQVVEEQKVHLKNFQKSIECIDKLAGKTKELQTNQTRMVYCILFYFGCKVISYFLFKN